eukprot:Nk52_evm11s1607 gene=Nk52_evmTU11s1607
MVGVVEIGNVVRVREGLGEEEGERGGTSVVCVLCGIQFARYTCPRCLVRYCSLECYRGASSHEECAEAFYREDCITQLQGNRVSADRRREMQEILSRAQQDEEEEGEEDLEDDLFVRLKRIGVTEDRQDSLKNVAGEVLWDLLTPKEREEFKQAVSSGKIGEYVDVWVPWWEKEEELARLGICSHVNTSNTGRAPRIIANIPLFSSLVPASSRCKDKEDSSEAVTFPLQLVYSLVYTLHCYAATMRIFNGILWGQDSETEGNGEALTFFMRMCKVLNGEQLAFMSMDEMVAHVLKEDFICVGNGVQKKSLLEHKLRQFSDTQRILRGELLYGSLLCVLSDIYRALGWAIESRRKAKGLVDVKRKVLKLAQKKVEYLLSWWSFLSSVGKNGAVCRTKAEGERMGATDFASKVVEEALGNLEKKDLKASEVYVPVMTHLLSASVKAVEEYHLQSGDVSPSVPDESNSTELRPMVTIMD